MGSFKKGVLYGKKIYNAGKTEKEYSFRYFYVDFGKKANDKA
jgi:hypothetical protein